DAADDPIPPATGPSRDRYRVERTLHIGRVPAKGPTLHLPHPQVSRSHARIDATAAGLRVQDLGSTLGTFVNGERLSRSRLLRDGDRLHVGPYSLVVDRNEIRVATAADRVDLEISDLGLDVDTRDGRLTLLDGLSFRVPPGRFVAILGPSGSGKSTLLRVLSGQVVATRGSVTLNGAELLDDFDALKSHVAYVPQHEVLYRELSVLEGLRYSARLRLPLDTERTEVEARVAELLDQLDLGERGTLRVDRLSGGQLRRVSLANELLSDPDLLLLDEVTSGLDIATDHDVMRAIHGLTRQGKSALLVTHNVGHIDEFCDLVVCLTVGGKLAYCGPPSEACRHFEASDLGQVYRLLRDGNRAAEWRDRFARLRKDTEPRRESRPRRTPTATRSSAHRLRRWLHQSRILSRRYLHVLLRDRRNLGFLLGQPVVVGLLLAAVFGRIEIVRPEDALGLTNLLFLAAVSCTWFGCSAASKEIVKERALFRQERLADVRALPYFFSKLAVLSTLLLIQCSVLFGALTALCDVPANAGSLFLACWATGLSGMFLGLGVSGTSPNTDVAAAVVPICLIPQVILGGAIATLEGAPLWIARLSVSNYWCFGLFNATHDTPVPHLGEMPDAGTAAMALTLMALVLSGSTFGSLLRRR
ncbi:MAG: ATP-binding cassette domain-containing protein, partial [Planctomycetes bacterium]|nr:ATP-binding cassette domain-containing protein [Planctomycetota bacterium]